MTQCLELKKLLLQTVQDLQGLGIGNLEIMVIEGPDNYTAFEAWFKDIEKKYPRNINSMMHEFLPSFIKEKLLNIKNDHFGFDAFGLND